VRLTASASRRRNGTYVVEFKTADRESLAISIPRTETAVNALWALRAGRSVRNLWRAHVSRARALHASRRGIAFESPPARDIELTRIRRLVTARRFD
jgi:hypothetical protein